MKLCPCLVHSPSMQHRAARLQGRRNRVCGGWGVAVCPSHSRRVLLDGAEALSFPSSVSSALGPGVGTFQCLLPGPIRGLYAQG